jgi:hypothetical protein
MFCIFPISSFLLQYYYKWDLNYAFNPGHLWFLGNIFAYVLILSPVFFYFKHYENGKAVKFIKKMFSNPLGLLTVAGAFILEVIVIQPYPYELYAMTWHGFVLGLLAFFFGFCFMLAGDDFWQMIYRWRWLFLVIATMLFVFRINYFGQNVPGYLLVTESDCWIFSIFAFGSRYLNHGGRALAYLSQAAYPVYILHMIFLFLGSLIIFPLSLPVEIKFLLVLAFTVVGCFVVYESMIRRIRIIRPLFGLKMKDDPKDRQGRCDFNIQVVVKKKAVL